MSDGIELTDDEYDTFMAVLAEQRVDHAHDTGKVRGLLCQSCNGGMGVLGEDNLEAAVDYLKESVS